MREWFRGSVAGDDSAQEAVSGSGGRRFRVRIGFPQRWRRLRRLPPSGRPVSGGSAAQAAHFRHRRIRLRSVSRRFSPSRWMSGGGATTERPTANSNPSAPRSRTLSSPRCSSNCISRPSKFGWNRVGSGLLRVRFRPRPRLGCRIWAACFPAFRFFRSLGAFGCLAFAAARRAWKAMDNPFSRCIRVSGSGPGLTTLPTLPAVGAGPGSSLFVPQQPCGAFS